MLAWKIGPTSASGCSVIVKPAAETSFTALRVAEIVAETGLPIGRHMSDLKCAIRGARAIRAGPVTVNSFGVGYITTPFGGFNPSAFGGRDNGVHVPDQYTQLQTIWIDQPMMRTRRWIDRLLRQTNPGASRARGVVRDPWAAAILINGYGRPFASNGFGNRFRDWYNEAGLTHRAVHGLRKVTGSRLAEVGCTEQEIMTLPTIRIIDRTKQSHVLRVVMTVGKFFVANSLISLDIKRRLVPRRGLEPPRPFGHWHLKPARLPIPPPGQAV